MGRPSFFIVGAARSGTTSLAKLLSENPSIYFSDPKETRFFSENYDKGISYYKKKYFGQADQPLIGEGDVSYFVRPRAAPRIARHYPESRIVILLRNPIDRAYSAYSLGVRVGRFEKPFGDILEKNLEQLKSLTQGKKEYHEINWESELLQTGHYVHNIRRFLKFWGREKIKVMIFERMLQNTRKELEELYGFLGIHSHREFTLPHENIYAPISYSRYRKRLKSLKKYKFIKPFVKLEKKIIKKIFSKETPKMDPNGKEFLYDYYKKRVEDLKEFLDDELPEWSAFRSA